MQASGHTLSVVLVGCFGSLLVLAVIAVVGFLLVRKARHADAARANTQIGQNLIGQ